MRDDGDDEDTYGYGPTMPSFDLEVATHDTPSRLSVPFLTPSTSTSGESAVLASPPKPPVRVIDEDYDEGVDHTRIRRHLARAELSSRYGIREGMDVEETLDKLVQGMPKRWSISGSNARTGSAASGAPGLTRSASLNVLPVQMTTLHAFQMQ